MHADSFALRSGALLGAVVLALLGCGDADADPADGHAKDAGTAGSAPVAGGSTSGAGGRIATAGQTAPSAGTHSEPPTAGVDASQPALDGGTDAGTGRRFALASAGTQLLIGGAEVGLQLTPANLADDVDVVAVHQEFYGVPWPALLADTEPPAEWLAKVQQLADEAHAIGDVFLSVNMLNGARDSLAERTKIENGQVKSDDHWAASCYDFASASDAAQYRAAYLRYVTRMLELFTPRYFNYAVEVNLFLEKCPAAAPGLVDLANDVYARVKAEHPNVIAFPSIQIDHLYGQAEDSCPAGMDKDVCFDRNYAQIADLQRDRFAISSYPFLQGQTVADLPSDWFERGDAVAGERALIAETGWLSTDLVAQRGSECIRVIPSDQATAAAYLERVLSDAERVPLELVTWWSNRDLLPSELMTSCPCSYEDTWCSVIDLFRASAGGGVTGGYLGEVLIKAFGTMGIREYDGVPKPGLASQWSEARTGR